MDRINYIDTLCVHGNVYLMTGKVARGCMFNDKIRRPYMEIYINGSLAKPVMGFLE